MNKQLIEREGMDAMTELRLETVAEARPPVERRMIISEILRLKKAAAEADKLAPTPCALPGCDQLCHPSRHRNVYTALGAACCIGHARALGEYATSVLGAAMDMLGGQAID